MNVSWMVICVVIVENSQGAYVATFVMTTFVQDVTRSATIKNHVMTDRHG
jgi:hypothetical protein